ncbi:hypothetical protein EDB80DRAFT_382996 [Ilyonectria destructans]|nr:hypothetical protein EDB80DRAFT_382996 [Ilyonectria destructans]
MTNNLYIVLMVEWFLESGSEIFHSLALNINHGYYRNAVYHRQFAGDSVYVFKHIPAASAVAFRFWMVLEWVIVISGPWSTYLSSSIIVSSMIRECFVCWWFLEPRTIAFAPWPLAFLLETTVVSFIVSTILASRSAVFNELSAASSITFRCWMVLEWMLIAPCTSRQFTKIKTVMLIETLAMIASAIERHQRQAGT